ncbi:MAG: 2Fe-2S iron-sulfur cluster binding domain-containing protein [Methylobacteriaceae bacterium]|nr:2Fe-2S iron-sulfur cluster binding domain-containing protein [Methylobacteriaceae bacterium]
MLAAAPHPVSVALAPDRPVWGGGTLVCRAIIEETHDVKTFVFAAPSPARFSFLPGQFLTFAFDIVGRSVERCYTISSPSTVDATLSITVKRVPNGVVSPWLHDRLRVGDRLRARGPDGQFTPVEHRSDRYLFLSGGSGITPLASITRTFADLGEDCDILFVHAARTPRDIIFRDDLARLARHLPRLRLSTIVEDPVGEPGWAGFVGRLDRDKLAVIAPDLASRMVMCCGPAPFMAAARRLVLAAGLSGDLYAEESFDFGDAPNPIALDAAPASGAGTASKITQIRFAKSQRSFPCDPGMTILEAARRAGVPLPFACSKGICGTCKSRKLSGTVEMTHGGGIRPREIDQGLILPCCSRPCDDVVLDR